MLSDQLRYKILLLKIATKAYAERVNPRIQEIKKTPKGAEILEFPSDDLFSFG